MKKEYTAPEKTIIINGIKKYSSFKKELIELSNDKIFGIYQLVEDAFTKIAEERKEVIKQPNMNYIVLHYFSMYHLLGEEQMNKHLKMGLMMYKMSGLEKLYRETEVHF